jgi:hypothetical protein
MKREEVKNLAERTYNFLADPTESNLNPSEIRKVASRLWSLADCKLRVEKTTKKLVEKTETIEQKTLASNGCEEETDEEKKNWAKI